MHLRAKQAENSFLPLYNRVKLDVKDEHTFERGEDKLEWFMRTLDCYSTASPARWSSISRSSCFRKSFGIIASLSEEQSAVELKSGNESSGGDLNGYYEVTDGENTTHYYIDIYKHYEHMSPSKHRIVRSYRTLYVETFYYTEFEVLE